MTARAIDKEAWAGFCAAVSEALEGSQAEIEIASPSLGGQVQKEWAPLIGISYDPEDDIIDVAFEDFDHIVNRPQELIADVGDPNMSALQITDADGTRHVVKLKDLPQLQG